MCIKFEDSSVQSYIGTLQTVINRMATNSANCKTWCITLVSAIAVVISSEDKPACIWIALIPLVLFLFLDAYYLGLERGFISRYNEFIKKVQNKDATVIDLYVVIPIRGFSNTFCAIFRAFGSFSIWPFYGLLFVMLLVARYAIL